jgi:sugar phosphate isomerase/epimerase
MHDNISVNSLCFPGAPLAGLAQSWDDLGARRVSVISPLLQAEGVPAVREVLRTGDYALETIAHQFVVGQLSPSADARAASRAALDGVIKAAAELGGRSIYMTTGGHGTLTWEQAAEVFSEAIAPCLATAGDAGIELMIENAATLYADIHIAHSLVDAVALAEMAGIGICIDLFGCWSEAGLHEAIERAVPRCHLVQVSDYLYGDRALPARAVPGDGAMPLTRLTQWLIGAGYSGVFDLELIGPRIDAEGHLEATRRAAHNFGDILLSLTGKKSG